MKALIEQLPKSELHLHVRGAMPVEVFARLLSKYSVVDALGGPESKYYRHFERYDNIRPFLVPERRHWSPDEVAPLFKFTTFEQFLETFNFAGFYLREPEDMRALVLGVVEHLRAQNIVYAEITVSMKEYLRSGLKLSDVIQCLEDGTRVPGIRVQWIVDLVRDFGVESGLVLLEEIIAQGSGAIVGITLGGSEHRFPPAMFAEVYRRARDKGLRLTVHAGEALGPESVWSALRDLGVERVGHGVRAVEDRALVKYLVEHDIALEVCPTSNLKTGIYPDYASHPVRALHDAGVPITINSDDPTFFSTSLAVEYEHVYNVGVTEDGIRQMLRNGFKYAFLPEPDVQAYLDRFDMEWRRLTRPA